MIFFLIFICQLVIDFSCTTRKSKTGIIKTLILSICISVSICNFQVADSIRVIKDSALASQMIRMLASTMFFVPN